MKQSKPSDGVDEGPYCKFGLQFHHFGLAAPDPVGAKKFLEYLGYRGGNTIFDPLQNVNLIMCYHKSMPAVEIISPASAGQGPVSNLLAKHRAGLVYHLCFRTDNVSDCLKSMEAAGLRPFEVSPPRPAVLFGGDLVSFYMIPSMGLIEIIEGVGKAGL